MYHAHYTQILNIIDGVRKGRVEKSKKIEGCGEKRRKNSQKMKTQKSVVPSKR